MMTQTPLQKALAVQVTVSVETTYSFYNPETKEYQHDGYLEDLLDTLITEGILTPDQKEQLLYDHLCNDDVILAVDTVAVEQTERVRDAIIATVIAGIPDEAEVR